MLSHEIVEQLSPIFFHEIVEHMCPMCCREVWIGLSSRETPGTFVWEDAAQTPLTDTNWTNWARSE